MKKHVTRPHSEREAITDQVCHPVLLSVCRRALFVDILEEAREMAMEQHHGRTLMYTVIGTDWRPFGHPRIRRPIASVVLDKTIREGRTTTLI